eukprot:COSAG01_NODE_2619_length_7370_cov_8.551506_9_plen_186_part_00
MRASTASTVELLQQAELVAHVKDTVHAAADVPEVQRRLVIARAAEDRARRAGAAETLPSSKLSRRVRREVADAKVTGPQSPAEAVASAEARRQARQTRARPWRVSKEERLARIKREAAHKFGEGCATGAFFTALLSEVKDAKTTCEVPCGIAFCSCSFGTSHHAGTGTLSCRCLLCVNRLPGLEG